MGHATYELKSGLLKSSWGNPIEEGRQDPENKDDWLIIVNPSYILHLKHPHIRTKQPHSTPQGDSEEFL